MPPKRKRAAGPSSQRAVSGRADADAEGEEPPPRIEAEMSSSPEERDPPPKLFDTTFSALRASPLYLGARALSAARLRVLGQRLREALVGDVVRGVHIGGGPDAAILGNAGVLVDVVCRMVRVRDLLRGRGAEEEGEGDEDEEMEDAEDEVAARRRRRKAARALAIELHYESTTFTALLLPDFAGPTTQQQQQQPTTMTKTRQWTSHPSLNLPPPAATAADSSSSSEFAHLPLLLLRMPSPLRAAVVDFLARSFDCRVSPLLVGTRTLVQSLEGWLAAAGRHAKDCNLTLGFDLGPRLKAAAAAAAGGGRGGGEGDGSEKATGPPPQPGLRTIEVSIPADEVLRFASAGAAHLSNTNTNTNTNSKAPAPAPTRTSSDQQPEREEGWAWRQQPSSNADGSAAAACSPFVEAAARYLDRHLALNLFDPSVRVLRVACDGFVAGLGRVKLFGAASSEDAAAEFVGRLAARARGDAF